MVLLKLELLIVWVLEGIVIKYKEKKLLKDIIHGNQLGKQKEPMARVVRELRQSVAKSLYSSDWFKDESLLLYWSKIYVPNIIDLYRRVVILYHNLKVAE